MRYKPLTKVFADYRSRHARWENQITEGYLDVLMNGSYASPRKEKVLRMEAYALAQTHILENAMMDTRDYLAGEGIWGADRLFKEPLSGVRKTRIRILEGWMKKDIKRRILWHEIGDTWGQANHEVEKLPVIAESKKEKGSMAA